MSFSSCTACLLSLFCFAMYHVILQHIILKHQFSSMSESCLTVPNMPIISYLFQLMPNERINGSIYMYLLNGTVYLVNGLVCYLCSVLISE